MLFAAIATQDTYLVHLELMDIMSPRGEIYCRIRFHPVILPVSILFDYCHPVLVAIRAGSFNVTRQYSQVDLPP